MGMFIAMILSDGSGGKNTAIGIGMWLGLIMAHNVWFRSLIKKALGMVEVTPEVKLHQLKLQCYFQEITHFFSTNVIITGSSSKSINF